MSLITSDQIKQYNQDGYVIVENVFSEQELKPVLKEFEDIVDEFVEKAFAAKKISNKHSEKNVFRRLAFVEKDFPGSSVLIHHKGSLRPELANLWGSHKLLDIIEHWVGRDICGHPDWNIRSKTPQTTRMTLPWHQDSGYFKEGAEKTIKPAAWIPFLDVNKNNGCLQVVRGGHRSGQVLDHKLEKEVGDKDSWYLYIDEKDIPTKDIVTCEMSIGSILFIHQLTPHRSLENYSEDVRWSIDLRFQNPNDETGFHERSSLVDPIILRKAEDPNYKPNWNTWLKEYEVEYDNARGRSDKDEFDSKNIEGAWMKRWEK